MTEARLNSVGPLEIRFNQRSDARDMPIYDEVARTHTIQSIEFDWQGSRYIIDRDDAGSKGVMIRQSTRADEPGVTRIEIVARELRAQSHEIPPWEHFLFKVNDLMQTRQDASGSSWTHAELIGYQVVSRPEGQRFDA